MPNHFHVVWQLIGDQDLSKVQLRLMKFIAQKIKFDLQENHQDVLAVSRLARSSSQEPQSSYLINA
ncbi:MAG TPA: hypothetical protein DCF33_14295 [Saprospirales bacterium]|nr:hypothetical protein [Saprospirales bacterium]